MEIQTTLFSNSVSETKKQNLFFIRYMGGKYNHLSFIFNHFPEKHNTYIEVFGGSGAVLLNKLPSKIEIYNDIDDFLYNLFKVVQNEEKFKKFKNMLEYSLFSRKIFTECVERYANNEYTDDVQKAYDIFIILLQGFNARITHPSFSLSFSKNEAPSFFRKIENLHKIHNRLKNVIIECLDFRELFKKYIHPQAFFYIDPPYLEKEKTLNHYRFDFSKSDHEELIEIILNMSQKCLFLISGYENDIYNKLCDYGFKKSEKETYARSTGVTRHRKEKTRKKIREILWYNYKPKFIRLQKQQQTLFPNSILHEQCI